MLLSPVGDVQTDDASLKMVSNNNALDRAEKPEDIGGEVAFLCTEDRRWVNGQRIVASGGDVIVSLISCEGIRPRRIWVAGLYVFRLPLFTC